VNPLASQDLRPAATAPRKHQLPPLAYDYAALEPVIDARTMKLHHDVHHAGYVEKLNAALERFPDLRGTSALSLLRNLDMVPEEIRGAVRNNAGGHVNHCLFWQAIRPGASREPQGPLREAIIRSFGSVAALRTRFEAAGTGLFGSGWVWLVQSREDGGRLEVITTTGHDHPMMLDRIPLLLNDVWEHAYYLHYESRRADYLKACWSVLDWDEAARCFARAFSSAEELWEAEGGQLFEIAGV
jgi:Fe-Mn family superoxide dismutase